MTSKILLALLTEQGYAAGLAGDPCDAPTKTGLQRAAWENGWRRGKHERDSKEKVR
jgi:ribosome modulation factor